MANGFPRQAMICFSTGADVFVFQDGYGLDQIEDFEAGIDKIDVSSVSAFLNYADLVANHMTQSAADVLVSD